MSTLVDMDSRIQRDDAAFRPSLDANIFTTTFAEDSPAFNVATKLQADLDKHIASQDGTSHGYIYHRAAQVIRVILKNWRVYPGLAKEYRPNPNEKADVVDKLDYVSTALYTIKENRQVFDSLEYKMAHCFTDEIKKYDSEQFTEDVLQSIIDGASKAYLEIMAYASAMSEDDRVRAMTPDPLPTTATYTYYPSNPEDVHTKSREEPFPLHNGSQKKVADAPNPTKRASKMESAPTEGSILRFIGQTPAMQTPMWNAINKPMQATGAGVAGTTFINQAQTTPPIPTRTAVNTNVNTNAVPGKRKGKHGQPAGIKWTTEEEDWMRQHIRASPGINWAQHTAAFNAVWANTRFDAGHRGFIDRRDRTRQAVIKRFQEFKIALKAGREPTGAEQGAEADVDSTEQDPKV